MIAQSLTITNLFLSQSGGALSVGCIYILLYAMRMRLNYTILLYSADDRDHYPIRMYLKANSFLSI